MGKPFSVRGFAAAGVFDERFFACLRELADASRLRNEAGFCQHGTTSTLLHSLAVAHLAGHLAQVFGHGDRLDEAFRAGMLHDYYLYDWHDGCEENAGHATRHAGRALTNALCDVPDLTERERDAIACHMFPLNRPPRHHIGWILTVADKMCASYETSVRKGVAYPRLRAKCARYMPDLELGIVSRDELCQEGAQLR